MDELLEFLEIVKTRPHFEEIREVVKIDLKKFMIGDSYNDAYYLQVTKISASYAYKFLHVFLYSKEITQEQVFDTLMSFDVTILHNAQLLMDYIYIYEMRDPKWKAAIANILLLDTHKLFNKLRTEMPVEFRKNRAIWLPLQEMQEKGLDFKW